MMSSSKRELLLVVVEGPRGRSLDVGPAVDVERGVADICLGWVSMAGSSAKCGRVSFRGKLLLVGLLW